MKPNIYLIPVLEKALKVSAVCDLLHSCDELSPISKSSRTKNNYLFKDVSKKLTEDLFKEGSGMLER